MIDRATIDRIYSAANIVDIVGDFVTLKKKGVNYQACCPFHNEKTPSFVVSPSKGLYKCFGCGKGGNAVTFVMEHENLGYVDALKYVAKKYGIEVQEKELSPEEVRRNDDRESMMVVSSYAADYFQHTLHDTSEGQSVGIGYFRERGFSDATIRKFGLGFCPASGDAFTQAALKAGYKEEFLTGTGLTILREQGGYYDRFAGRVIFPIHSISGRVTAFGGRTLRTDKKVAKYLNSPESEIYHKSDILYGLFFAKKAITQDDYCILVEGYTDVISMHQSGVENVVASSGTSLTEGQIRLISRFTKNITVIYDGDSAGIKASLRGIDMILREGLNVRVVLLPDGDDPDSFARKHNSTELKEFIRSAEEDFISFKTRLLLSDAGSDPIKRAGLITDIVASIAEIPEPITRSVYIKECSRNLGIEEQLLREEVARKRITHSDPATSDFIRRQQSIQRREGGYNQGYNKGNYNQGNAGGSYQNQGGYSNQGGDRLNRGGYSGGNRNNSLQSTGYGTSDPGFIPDPSFDPAFAGAPEDLFSPDSTPAGGQAPAPYSPLRTVHPGSSIEELEKELVKYLLKYGGQDFEYKEGKSMVSLNVAEVIISDLRTDSIVFQNPRYKAIYEQYLTYYDAHETVPVHSFINHSDPAVCNCVVDILTEDDNYIASKLWKKHDISVESEQERLSVAVPRAIILYKSKAVALIIADLYRQLADPNLPEEEQIRIIQSIAKLNDARTAISKKLDRLIL